MPLSPIQHRRTHNLLLIKKLLECRDNASPFTLVVDSLNQSAKPLLREIAQRANKSRTRLIFLAWDTLKEPAGVDIFLSASPWDLHRLEKELQPHLKDSKQRTVIIFDCLNILLNQTTAQASLPAFLSSLITPTTSIVAGYHADVPVSHDLSSYSPSPLTLLKYLATTVLFTHSLSHLVAAREARQRSLAEPLFGLAEDREGVVIGKGSNHVRGIVIEMEFRRKSGRAIHEVFFLPHRANDVKTGLLKGTSVDKIMLLDDLPQYKAAGGEELAPASEGNEGDGSTFNLSLTEKQRRDREGIVLPYFDAQKVGGVGEGGRILYEMGVEDDFDEEEDEI